jgi:hypothetical protein
MGKDGALYLLGRHYYFSHTPTPLFCYSVFSDSLKRFCLGLDRDPPTYASSTAGIIEVKHHA